MKAALLVVAAASIAACGSAPESTENTRPTTEQAESRDQAAEQPSSRSDSKSVCAMIPKAEMETILGGPLATADAKDTPGKTQCTYAGFGGRFADVAIEWGNGEAGMAGARLASKLMGATAGAIQVTTPVEGLGDEALMLIGGVLNVRTGADLITVDLRAQKNAAVVGPAIARKIIEKM